MRKFQVKTPATLQPSEVTWTFLARLAAVLAQRVTAVARKRAVRAQRLNGSVGKALQTLMFLLAVGICPYVCLSQDTGISQQHHPWGAFKPGAWKLVRVVTETLDDKGFVASTSVTETKTTLVQVERDGVTLDVAVCVEVAGKQFYPDPQTVKQGLHGEMVGQKLKFKESGTAQVVVENRKITCKVIQLEFSGANNKTTTNVYYSPTISPYILKRRSVTTDMEGKTLSETSVDVVAQNMPCKVLVEIKNTSFVKAVQKHPKGTIFTWTWTSTAVPGGIIAHSSKELDTTGRVIRRSTLELLDYGLESEIERTGIFGRRRPTPARLRRPR